METGRVGNCSQVMAIDEAKMKASTWVENTNHNETSLRKNRDVFTKAM